MIRVISRADNAVNPRFPCKVLAPSALNRSARYSFAPCRFMNGFLEDDELPLASVRVTIGVSRLHLMRAAIDIDAQLTGLRYKRLCGSSSRAYRRLVTCCWVCDGVLGRRCWL